MKFTHAPHLPVVLLLAATVCPLAAAGERTRPDSTGWAYWTQNALGTVNDGIYRVSLDGTSGIQPVVSLPKNPTYAELAGIAEPVGIAVDSEHGKIYWTTLEWEASHLVRVMRANTDGTQMEMLVEGPDTAYDDIVLDPLGGRMYWLRKLAPSGKVYSANMNDGSDVQTIASFNTPSSLAIDLPTRKLYWGFAPNLACGQTKIQTANLDGTNVQDVPVSTWGPINAIAVDSALGMIFWRDGCIATGYSVHAAMLDGAQSDVILAIPSGQNTQSLALDIPNEHLYWGQSGSSGAIRRMNFLGENPETIVSLTPPLVPRKIALDLGLPVNPFDLNHDGHVNGLDLAILLGQWTGSGTYAPCPPHRTADLNQDCKVNGLDLAMLLGGWSP